MATLGSLYWKMFYKKYIEKGIHAKKWYLKYQRELSIGSFDLVTTHKLATPTDNSRNHIATPCITLLLCQQLLHKYKHQWSFLEKIYNPRVNIPIKLTHPLSTLPFLRSDYKKDKNIYYPTWCLKQLICILLYTAYNFKTIRSLHTEIRVYKR